MWRSVCVCVLHNTGFLYGCSQTWGLFSEHSDLDRYTNTYVRTQRAVFIWLWLQMNSNNFLHISKQYTTGAARILSAGSRLVGGCSHVPREWLHVTRDEREGESKWSALTARVHVTRSAPLIDSFLQEEVLQHSNVTTNDKAEPVDFLPLHHPFFLRWFRCTVCA